MSMAWFRQVVAITAVNTKGVGLSFNVSQTWNTSASMTMIEVTSSTTLASRADRTQTVPVKIHPFICRR